MLMGWPRQVAALLIHETKGGAIPNVPLLLGLALLSWATIIGIGLSAMYWLTSCLDCAVR
jgi:hypothetical protein